MEGTAKEHCEILLHYIHPLTDNQYFDKPLLDAAQSDFDQETQSPDSITGKGMLPDQLNNLDIDLNLPQVWP